MGPNRTNFSRKIYNTAQFVIFLLYMYKIETTTIISCLRIPNTIFAILENSAHVMIRIEGLKNWNFDSEAQAEKELSALTRSLLNQDQPRFERLFNQSKTVMETVHSCTFASTPFLDQCVHRMDLYFADIMEGRQEIDSFFQLLKPWADMTLYCKVK